MDVYKVHPITVQALDSRHMGSSRALVEAFSQEVESADPSYFAPFLRNLAKRSQVEEWVGELASWEWALFHASQTSHIGSPDRRVQNGYMALSESVSLVLLKWNVLDWILHKKEPEKKEQLLKIWFDESVQKPVAEEISLEEAYVLDTLRDGPLTLEDISIQITSKGLNLEILNQMNDRGILKYVQSEGF